MKCSVENCEKEARHKGWCTTHYKRWWRHGDVNHCETNWQQHSTCLVDGCGNPPKSLGLCALHYQRQNRYGRTENIVAPRGSGTVNSQGYVVLTIDGQRKYEHVVLAEKALGKTLPKGAVVHHMNSKPWDNHTPFNLVICPDQDYHMLLHRRMKELGYPCE